MNKNIFKKKSYKSVRVGEWLFEWFVDEKHPDRSNMRVVAESGLFDLRIKANSHVFGYLLAAAERDMLDQLHGWITLVYIPAMAMTQEQGLTDDVQRAIQKWMKRRETEAKTAAKLVTPEQEEADAALMQSVVEFVEAAPKRRKEIQAEDKALLKDVLSEKGEGE